VAESKDYIRKLKDELKALREQATSSGMLYSVHFKVLSDHLLSR
jgi:hypothetical protein